MRAAHERNIKVLTELVINHTSDQHPWFQRARRAPQGSPERDFYVWSDTDTKFPENADHLPRHGEVELGVGPGRRASTTGTASSHTSRISTSTTRAVVDAVIDVMRFWLDMGVDALRLDAVPYLMRARRHEQREPARRRTPS